MIRLAVIGAGNFARQIHLPNTQRLQGACLATVCDRDEATLASVAERWQPDTTTMDADAVFADPSIDAVIIAVRDHLQAGMAAQALAAGKAVYVEKPVATDEAGIAPVITGLQQGPGIGAQLRRRPHHHLTHVR
jgi:predicted dehydrogenase